MTGRAATICCRTPDPRSSSTTPTRVAPFGISSTTAPIPQPRLPISAGDVASATPSKATRYSNINFIWSHAGGSLLGLVGRFLGRGARPESLGRTPPSNSRLHHLRRFYYDTAGIHEPHPDAGFEVPGGDIADCFRFGFSVWADHEHSGRPAKRWSECRGTASHRARESIESAVAKAVNPPAPDRP